MSDTPPLHQPDELSAHDRAIITRGTIGALPATVAALCLLWYAVDKPPSHSGLLLAGGIIGALMAMTIWLRCAIGRDIERRIPIADKTATEADHYVDQLTDYRRRR